MAASNSRSRAPFLTYLTLFQSRIAVANLVLPLAGATPKSREVLARKLRATLQQKVQVQVVDSYQVLEYLLLKKFVGKAGKFSKRYPGITVTEQQGVHELADNTRKRIDAVNLYQIDLWMGAPELPSVVGVPTPDNVDEIIDFCSLLGLISSTSYSWTGSGQVAMRLRECSPTKNANPFLLGPEVSVILRQLIERDGLMLAALLRQLAQYGPLPIKRDEISRKLPEIARNALELAKARLYSAQAMTEGKRFLRLVEKTGDNRANMTDAPGVLEHRITPRLEWLTDIGALSKKGHAKNGFEYQHGPDFDVLCEVFERWLGDACPDEATLDYWRHSETCSLMRSAFSVEDVDAAILDAYDQLKRPVGPVAIRDLLLVAAMKLPSESLRISDLESRLIGMSQNNKGINLSGGRYKRGAEFVHVSEDVLRSSGTAH